MLESVKFISYYFIRQHYNNMYNMEITGAAVAAAHRVIRIINK